MATDNHLLTGHVSDIEAAGPFHAIQALIQLHAEDAIESLLIFFKDFSDDNWFLDHGYLHSLLRYYQEIGLKALPALITLLSDTAQEEYARGYAGECIGAIGQQYPEIRLECIQALVSTLNTPSSNNEPTYDLNRFIIDALLDLKAVEALADIEQTYKENRVDTFLVNDWDIFQARMGLK
ncbi:MAG TPA: hypothetical protein VL485_17555 [Ktedonobacteraceae bacterium]|nr:hypothetical protein [Ktedonobacteraceae bacterium]